MLEATKEAEQEWARNAVLREREHYQGKLTSLAARLYPHVGMQQLQTETQIETAIRLAAAMLDKTRALAEAMFPMPAELKAVK